MVDHCSDRRYLRVRFRFAIGSPSDVTIVVGSVLSGVFIVVSSVLGNSLEFTGFT